MSAYRGGGGAFGGGGDWSSEAAEAANASANAAAAMAAVGGDSGVGGSPEGEKEAPRRMLQVEYDGQLHEWFDPAELGTLARCAELAGMLKENVARYFGVPPPQQAIYDEDGLLQTSTDFSRAMQRVSPKLFVYDVQRMVPEMKDRTLEALAQLEAEIQNTYETFGAPQRSASIGQGSSGVASGSIPQQQQQQQQQQQGQSAGNELQGNTTINPAAGARVGSANTTNNTTTNTSSNNTNNNRSSTMSGGLKPAVEGPVQPSKPPMESAAVPQPAPAEGKIRTLDPPEMEAYVGAGFDSVGENPATRHPGSFTAGGWENGNSGVPMGHQSSTGTSEVKVPGSAIVRQYSTPQQLPQGQTQPQLVVAMGGAQTAPGNSTSQGTVVSPRSAGTVTGHIEQRISAISGINGGSVAPNQPARQPPAVIGHSGSATPTSGYFTSHVTQVPQHPAVPHGPSAPSSVTSTTMNPQAPAGSTTVTTTGPAIISGRVTPQGSAIAGNGAATPPNPGQTPTPLGGGGGAAIRSSSGAPPLLVASGSAAPLRSGSVRRPSVPVASGGGVVSQALTMPQRQASVPASIRRSGYSDVQMPAQAGLAGSPFGQYSGPPGSCRSLTPPPQVGAGGGGHGHHHHPVLMVREPLATGANFGRPLTPGPLPPAQTRTPSVPPAATTATGPAPPWTFQPMATQVRIPLMAPGQPRFAPMPVGSIMGEVRATTPPRSLTPRSVTPRSGMVYPPGSVHIRTGQPLMSSQWPVPLSEGGRATSPRRAPVPAAGTVTATPTKP
mmetsp:Transcript_21447/g.46613  ORF Transcript_21447/g.46613 Transcript_21447/m.46613 type:complete len:779 (-) Transcript_21447:263-2599(-)